MRTKILVFTMLAFLLAACGGAATQAPAALPETEAPAMTEAPVMTDEAVPTEAPADLASSSGAVVYQIVPGESHLQYEVGETFINDNNRFNLAIGVTSQVSGEITVDMANPQNSTFGSITADVSQFTSDSSRRDNFIRRNNLQSSQFPNVTFLPTSIEGLPQTYTEGQEISLKIIGDLTIREVTKPVSFDATVKVGAGTLSGQVVTTIQMSEFEFGPISIAGILNTEDEAKVTLTLVARP